MPTFERQRRELFVPVAIYLSASSTGGDRLLFHYPFVSASRSVSPTPSVSPCKSPPSLSTNGSPKRQLTPGVSPQQAQQQAQQQQLLESQQLQSTRAYRFGADVRRWRLQSESAADFAVRDDGPSFLCPPPGGAAGGGEATAAAGAEARFETSLPYNLSGSTLASLFTSLCTGTGVDRRVELRIEDALFVGYPNPLEMTRDDQTILRFSVVFELHPLAPRSAIDIYHQLARYVVFALRNAEQRSHYLSQQKELITQVFDEAGEQGDTHQLSTFDLLLQRSRICQEMCAIFEDICSYGQVNLRINDWIPVSFCVPHLSYRVSASGPFFVPLEAVKSAVNNIQPYQGLILLDLEDVKANLMPDSNPTMLRFIKHLTPHKSLRQMALQTDIAYSHIFQLASNLVYWGKAIIIFPLCETNQYVLVPDLDLILTEKIANDFRCKFPSLNLIEILAEFSQPITVTEIKELHDVHDQTALVGWLLRHRLVVHLHTYVTLAPEASEASGEPRPEPAGRFPSWMGLGDRPLPKLIADSGQRASNLANEMTGLQIAKSDRSLIESLVKLSPSQSALKRLLALPVIGSKEELTRFVTLAPYFDGTNHLEHIMYHENILRRDLITLIDRCRSVLITTHLPDSRTACFFGL